MPNVTHPGAFLRAEVLPSLGLTITEAAPQLGIGRPQLSRILNARAAISPEFARRLAAWLGDYGPSAEQWLHAQASYDLAQVSLRGGEVTPAPVPQKPFTLED